MKKRDGFSKHVINFIEMMGFSAGPLNQQLTGQSLNNSNIMPSNFGTSTQSGSNFFPSSDQMGGGPNERIPGNNMKNECH